MLKYLHTTQVPLFTYLTFCTSGGLKAISTRAGWSQNVPVQQVSMSNSKMFHDFIQSNQGHICHWAEAWKC